MLFTEATNPAGPVFTWNAATNTFGPRINLGVNLTNLMSAVNRNGKLLAFDMGNQLLVMDNNYNVRNQLSGLGGGVVFDPNQDVMYAVNPAADQIVAFDTNTWAVKYQLPIGEPVSPEHAFGNGVMAVSNDSSMLFLATASGIREFNLTGTSGPAVQLSFSGLPQVTTAGVPNTFTVTALDANGHTASGYTGTISFFSSDPRAVLPANYTFTAADAGVHTFSAALRTAGGNQYIAAQDTVTGSIQGGVGGIVVNPGAVSQFVINAPTTPQPVGYAISLSVAAEDSSGNVITTYGGTVHFVSTDSAAWLPADYTYSANDRGVHTFSVIPKTAGNQSFGVSDRTNSNINGVVTVPIANYVPGLHFSVNVSPATNVAGAPFTVTVIALDTNNNVGVYYNGTVAFSAVAGSVLPANYTFTAADQGVHTFTNGATLYTAGNQSITVRDATFVSGGPAPSGTGTVTIVPAAASTLTIGGCPTSVTADVPVTFTVTARDTYGNVATNYAGSVHFTASDWRTVVPADSPLSNGTGTFSINFRTATTQSFSVWDAATGTPSSQQTGIVVNPGQVAGILANAGTTVTAGDSLAVTITAIDSAGNTAPSYRGTIQFNSSDPQATLPASYTFTATDNGVQTFTAILRTAGAQYLQAWDNGSFSYSIGTQATYTVNSAAASQLVLSGYPSATTAGTANHFTLTARDAFGNTATGYAGTVSFSSNDVQASLPAGYTFTAGDSGVHTFSATLKTAGSWSLTASDATSGFSANETGISVTAAAVAQFLISAPSTAQTGVAFGLTLTVVDAYGNIVTGYTGTVHFSSSDQQAGLPADYTFGSGDAGMHTFSVTLQTLGMQSITITDTLTDTLTASTQVSL